MPATTHGSDAAMPRGPDGGAPARAARAPTGVPQRGQKLEPGAMSVPQDEQAAASRVAPQDEQKRPDAVAPHEGQKRAEVGSVMRES